MRSPVEKSEALARPAFAHVRVKPLDFPDEHGESWSLGASLSMEFLQTDGNVLLAREVERNMYVEIACVANQACRARPHGCQHGPASSCAPQRERRDQLEPQVS